MFLPSGTMCNVVAILTHCRTGEEVVAHETSHILTSEGGSPCGVDSACRSWRCRARAGMFTADDVRAAIRPRTRYAPPQRLLEVEQTANIGGGTVWPLAQLNAVAAIARGEGWSTHMDGARLMNACVASGIAAKDMAAAFDSVWIDFTKGLGAPLGAVLAGSTRLHRRRLALEAAARRLACARPGICAAGCLHSLDHHVDRLADDHRNAKALARGLRADAGRGGGGARDQPRFLRPRRRRRAVAGADPTAAAAGRASEPARRPHPRLHASRRHARR